LKVKNTDQRSAGWGELVINLAFGFWLLAFGFWLLAFVIFLESKGMKYIK